MTRHDAGENALTLRSELVALLCDFVLPRILGSTIVENGVASVAADARLDHFGSTAGTIPLGTVVLNFLNGFVVPVSGFGALLSHGVSLFKELYR